MRYLDIPIKPAKEDAARIWPWRDAKLTKAVNDLAFCINTSGRRSAVSLPQFDDFFKVATKKLSPYDYQCRLACGDRDGRSEAKWLASGTECSSRLINIPTGLGKTAAK